MIQQKRRRLRGITAPAEDDEPRHAPISDKLTFIEIPISRPEEDLESAVRRGFSLAQKEISSSFLYDQKGSRLFEQITGLPEYYLTRCETEILKAHASDIFDLAKPREGSLQVVEFGSGSSEKTRLLLQAAIQSQGATNYVPIDISSDFLRISALELLSELPDLTITALGADYFDALNALPEHDGPRLFLFLGSTIGNFERDDAVAFLRSVRASMGPDDMLLVGNDLKKDPAVIEPAYNDAQGVTAQFNLNVLSRINQELCGNFNLSAFEHQAPWIEEFSRIEMRLVSTGEQDVEVECLDRTFHFKKGEYIHTENSHKWSAEAFGSMIDEAGLAVEERWTDSKEWFALSLLKVR